MGLTAYNVDKVRIKSAYPGLDIESKSVGRHKFAKPAFAKIDSVVEKFSDGAYKVTIGEEWFVLKKPRS